LIIPLHLNDERGLSMKGYQTVPVISYHKFSRERADVLTVKASVFEEQVRFLKENGYRVITLDQFFEFLNSRRPIPSKSVVITIDDNYYSTYDIAFPVLKKYGYPATLFVYTDLITSGGKSMNWAILSEMSKHGMDIQSHTKSHRNLAKRTDEESFRGYFEAIKGELAESAALIKKRLDKEVKYLAYPFGDTNPLVIALLTKLGYQGAFTVQRGSNPFFVHPYRINRSMIYGHFNLQDFQNSLTFVSDKDIR
jgi:peptidoglycan/xylan/chitin deacetylase (PgdA/CDA1 family)